LRFLSGRRTNPEPFRTFRRTQHARSRSDRDATASIYSRTLSFQTHFRVETKDASISRPTKPVVFIPRAREKHWENSGTSSSPSSPEEKKTKKGKKKRALSRRVCAGGVTHLAVRSARRSGEIRNLSGSERRGCGEHFLFACRVCSFSNGFRVSTPGARRERDFIAKTPTRPFGFFVPVSV